MLTEADKSAIENAVDAAKSHIYKDRKAAAIKKLILEHTDLMKKAYTDGDIERGKYEEEILYHIIDIL